MVPKMRPPTKHINCRQHHHCLALVAQYRISLEAVDAQLQVADYLRQRQTTKLHCTGTLSSYRDGKGHSRYVKGSVS
jgi:hypothetical protein